VGVGDGCGCGRLGLVGLGQLVGERSGCGRGAGEAVAGGGGRRWDIGGEVVGELGVVDGGADAAQDRDAQRVAEPITPLVETVRALPLDQPIGNAGWIAAAWLAVGVAISVPVTAVLFRRRTT
jgi:hypothetical protein